MEEAKKLEITWIFKKQHTHEMPYPATTAGPQCQFVQQFFIVTLIRKKKSILALGPLSVVDFAHSPMSLWGFFQVSSSIHKMCT